FYLFQAPAMKERVRSEADSTKMEAVKTLVNADERLTRGQCHQRCRYRPPASQPP
ncbi:hypothetical protein PIB30_073942, partial [Stylosanthes scabra]|nr:hypothetical protein [Stylosanthes scabra]